MSLLYSFSFHAKSYLPPDSFQLHSTVQGAPRIFVVYHAKSQASRGGAKSGVMADAAVEIQAPAQVEQVVLFEEHEDHTDTVPEMGL